ncbi:MAG TPA: DUF3857 domain-containing protein, partial [Opitutaceae bacterium]|nr:DUF3857 domain-containing protein [Opitutaceae bacterium]
SYQRLRWHYLRVWRDGTERDVLMPDALQVLRQEDDAEQFTYHGRLTALVILRDLRVGDVVEYAFTRTGENPVFADRFSTILSGASTVPIDRLYYRILTTEKRVLQVTTQGDFRPEHRMVSEGAMVEHTWAAADLKAIQPLSDAPGWEIQFPFVQVSEYASWKEVVAWGNRLFAVPTELSPALQERVEALTASLPTPEEKACALLQFVQDEIRYLAIELGQSSHKPSPPDEVLRQRFGDCKDKSLLLVTLLRSVGIEAHVALVNSNLTRRLCGLQPSPLSFDHAIVYARLPQRRRFIPYAGNASAFEFKDQSLLPEEPLGLPGSARHGVWLDPTISFQGGAADQRSLPNYGYALVLAPDTDDLKPVDLPAQIEDSVIVHEKFTVTNFDAPAKLEITTTYHDGTADLYRYLSRFEDPEHTTRQWAGLLARFYPKIRSLDTIRWTDDRGRNELVARSTFEISDFWPVDPQGRLRVAQLFPWALSERLPRPETTQRAFAYALPFPYAVREEIELQLPKNWPVHAEQKTVEDDTFRFGYLARSDGRQVHLSYTWRTLTDSVPATHMQEWDKKISDVRSLLGYQLSQNIRLAAEMNRSGAVWSLATFMVLGLAGGLLLGLWLYHLRPASADRPLALEQPSLVGISGWLILVAIGVTLRPVFLARWVLPMIRWIGNRPAWIARTDAESAKYISGFVTLMCAEGFAAAFLFAWACVIVIQFYRRKVSLPMALALLMTSEVVCVVALYFWRGQVIQDPFEQVRQMTIVVQSILGLLIWVPYLFWSRRVKLTFRN